MTFIFFLKLCASLLLSMVDISCSFCNKVSKRAMTDHRGNQARGSFLQTNDGYEKQNMTQKSSVRAIKSHKVRYTAMKCIARIVHLIYRKIFLCMHVLNMCLYEKKICDRVKIFCRVYQRALVRSLSFYHIIAVFNFSQKPATIILRKVN